MFLKIRTKARRGINLGISLVLVAFFSSIPILKDQFSADAVILACLAVIFALVVAGWYLLATLETQRDELRRAARNSTLGSIAASIAHEVNNPLTALMGSLSLLHHARKRGIELDQDKTIQVGIDSAQRIQRIIAALGHHTRTAAGKPAPVDLHKTILSTLDLCGPVFRKSGLQIETRLEATSPITFSKEGLIQTLLIQVLSDCARSKTPNSARVVISTRSDQEQLSLLLRISGKTILPSMTIDLLDEVSSQAGARADFTRSEQISLQLSFRPLESSVQTASQATPSKSSRARRKLEKRNWNPAFLRLSGKTR